MKVKIRIVPASLLLQCVMIPLGIHGFFLFSSLYVRPDYANDKSFIARKFARYDQVQRHGRIGFLIRYALYLLRYGPNGGPFEAEAKAAATKAEVRLYR